MENNTQLPVEVVLTKDEILHSHPIVSNNRGTDLFVSLESARRAMQTYADQYATKLHQADDMNKALAESHRSIEEQLKEADNELREAKKLLNEVLVMNEAWGDLPGAFIEKVNKFLYGE